MSAKPLSMFNMVSREKSNIYYFKNRDNILARKREAYAKNKLIKLKYEKWAKLNIIERYFEIAMIEDDAQKSNARELNTQQLKLNLIFPDSSAYLKWLRIKRIERYTEVFTTAHINRLNRHERMDKIAKHLQHDRMKNRIIRFKNSEIAYKNLLSELNIQEAKQAAKLKRKLAKQRNKKRRAGIEPPAYVNAVNDISATRFIGPPPPQYPQSNCLEWL